MSGVYRETRPVRWDKPGGPREKAAGWYIRWTGADGRQHKMKATRGSSRRDRARAEAMLEAKLHEVENERAGIRTSNPLRLRLEELLEDYLSTVRRRAERKQAAEIRNALRKAFKSMRAECVGHVDRKRVERYLDRLHNKDLAGRTINKHLGYLKAFFRWAVNDGQLGKSPVAGVEPRPQHLKKRHRQALSERAIGRVLAAARGPEAHAGEYLVYLLAFYLGLRQREIRGLRWGDIDLEGGRITIWAERQKGKKETRTPLPGAVAEVLRGLRARVIETTGAPPRVDAVVVKLPPDPPKALRKTLERAGIRYRDDLGRVCDYHALRHSFCTILGKRCSDIKTVKMLMRHSDIKITDGYLHTDEERQAEALAALPDFEAKRA